MTSASSIASTPSTSEQVQRARLVLRLPGLWVQLDPRDPQKAKRRARSYATEVVGSADDLATSRRLLAASAWEAIASEQETGLESLFLCVRVSRTTPTPMAIAVHSPTDGQSRTWQAIIGERPDGDRLLHAALASTAPDWQEVECADGKAFRRWDVAPIVPAAPTGIGALSGAGSDDQPRMYTATAWRAGPHGRLARVTLMSPLADIPHAMTAITDALLGHSRFAQ